MAVKYTNLPGIFVDLIDQGLSISLLTRGPRTLVLGTAESGTSDLYVVGSSSNAASEFGSGGTLTRGMYEVRQAGAENAILYRVGATAAKLEHVGDTLGVGGYTVETILKDDVAGSRYTIYYDDTSDRLVVWNALTGLTTYDNLTSDPIDTGEIIISGSRAAGGGPDIAGPSVGIALEDVVGAGHTGTAFTAGTDATSPSRMELWQYYHKAYKELVSQDFDFVVPMDCYMDDKNIVDGDEFAAAYLSGISGGDDYPTAESDDDILGKVYVEEYLGQYYYWWDLDGDGIADLYPSVGHASATLKIDGNSLSAADFHEVNFAYQLARFCDEVTTNNQFCIGSIGIRPPASLSLADLSNWVGKLPTYRTLSDGTLDIPNVGSNGTGLLGNKFMAGSYNYRAGIANGGFMRTDTDYLDGIVATDANGEDIDIGRHLNMVAAYLRLFNPIDTSGRGYVTSAAPTYMGFVSSLDEKRAPTNKVITGVRSVFTVHPRKIDDMAGAGYVFIFEKPKGLTISDAPTAARPTSDYRRLTTVRIVKRSCGTVRARGDAFVGNSFNGAEKAAMNTEISNGLDKLVQGGYLKRYEMNITQSSRQIVIGEATCELILVPAYELRRVLVTVSLQPQ